MAAPTNLGFEEAGAADGFPAGWVLGGKSSAVYVGGYAPKAFPPVVAPNDISDPSWELVNALLLPTSTLAPDGTGVGYALRVSTSNDDGLHYAGVSRDFEAGKSYSFSVTIRASSSVRPFIGVGVIDSLPSAFVLDAATSGRVVAESLGPEVDSHSISSYVVTSGSGNWYRITYVFRAAVSFVGELAVFAADPGGNLSFKPAATYLELLWSASICEGVPGPAEIFESGWDNDDATFVSPPSTAGKYATDLLVAGFPYEDFEVGWDTNQSYMVALASAVAGNDDTFESGWNNDGYIVEIPSTTAGNDEGFSSGWLNDAYATVFSPGDVSAGLFGGVLAIPYEGFEPVVLDHEFTAATSGVIASATHGLTNGVRIKVTSTGTLPGGLKDRDVYVVAGVTTDTYTLKTIAGVAVTIADTGTGTHTQHGDPATSWPSADLITT